MRGDLSVFCEYILVSSNRGAAESVYVFVSPFSLVIILGEFVLNEKIRRPRGIVRAIKNVQRRPRDRAGDLITVRSLQSARYYRQSHDLAQIAVRTILT